MVLYILSNLIKLRIRDMKVNNLKLRVFFIGYLILYFERITIFLIKDRDSRIR